MPNYITKIHVCHNLIDLLTVFAAIIANCRNIMSIEVKLNSNQNNDKHFMEHQPINTRYTQYNNDRKQELNEFRSIQTPQYEDRVPVNTRKDKNTINTNTYIPNSKILAIPKENI